MTDALNQANPEMNGDFLQAHQTLLDFSYTYDIVPSSTPENFQFSLVSKQEGKTEFIVKFNQQKESLFILSLLDNARCHIQMTETKLKYHLGTIGLQRFADGIVSLDRKMTKGFFSKHQRVLSGKYTIDAHDDSPEAQSLLGILVNMRYAASKAPEVYQRLKA